ncbi:MAG: Lrp/AsnC family transcriptional regulator [Eubacteriales bacterium]
MKDLLTLLQRDSTLSLEELSKQTGMSTGEIEEKRQKYEADGVICGYQALVDWGKCGKITALIEVRITPQDSGGFDRIAQRISRYEQVESVYLMSSGNYDLSVIISGSTLQEVAEFVSSHLALIKGVTGTSTHFILKKYKEHHSCFALPETEEREPFVL